MRYYQELSKRRKDHCRYLGIQLKRNCASDSAVDTLLNNTQATNTKLDYMRNINAELKKTRLFSFADKVDKMYESKYKVVYSNFVYMRNTVVSPGRPVPRVEDV